MNLCISSRSLEPFPSTHTNRVDAVVQLSFLAVGVRKLLGLTTEGTVIVPLVLDKELIVEGRDGVFVLDLTTLTNGHTVVDDTHELMEHGLRINTDRGDVPGSGAGSEEGSPHRRNDRG